jgi:hypothetical protein
MKRGSGSLTSHMFVAWRSNWIHALAVVFPFCLGATVKKRREGDLWQTGIRTSANGITVEAVSDGKITTTQFAD